MKQNYRNNTTVDFQGRHERQVMADEKIGCFTIIAFAVVIIVMILIDTFSK